MALFIATIASGYFISAKPGSTDTVGLDFIAFYSAGTFVREGRSAELYDLKSIHTFQHDLALQHGVDLGSAIGPWWNPPFYAWVFVPLARLPYSQALHLWLWFNVLCAGVATALLCRILTRPGDGQTSTINLRIWALVPVLLVLSTPFIHALSHAQNTCTSLLLLMLLVMAWRAEKGFTAGLLAGLLLYKPQLGAILIVILVITLGWRPLAGLALTGALLLLLMVQKMPGTLSLWLHQMPANLHFVIDQTAYLWDRHATFKAFWRLLLQGQAAGSPTRAVQILTLLTSGTTALLVVAAAVRTRIAMPRLIADGRRLDRMIAATIVCTPLIMPFYFDYDQLLLAIPAVLFAAEQLRSQSPLSDEARRTPGIDRWLPALWACWYAWLMINPDVALKTHVNVTVILLSGVAAMLLARAFPKGAGFANEWHSIVHALRLAIIPSRLVSELAPTLHAGSCGPGSGSTGPGVVGWNRFDTAP